MKILKPLKVGFVSNLTFIGYFILQESDLFIWGLSVVFFLEKHKSASVVFINGKLSCKLEEKLPV